MHEGHQENAAALIEINDFDAAWSAPRARQCCADLERGQILYFNGIPYDLPQADAEFLLSYPARDSRFHKNVSYRPATDVLRGFGGDAHSERRMQEVMRNYSRSVTAFTARLLAPYAAGWTLDYASFRPLEEASRDLSLHKRNDLLHVDAFPSRPTHGGRILRVFTNLSPDKPRVWNAGLPFAPLAERYAAGAGLKQYAAAGRLAGSKMRRALCRLGLPLADRSPYDSFMLHFHDWMKENAELQSTLPRRHLEFPPGCTWLVFTDGVPHAVLSGQFALEQTFTVPIEAMVTPELAPLHVLERLSGARLA